MSGVRSEEETLEGAGRASPADAPATARPSGGCAPGAEENETPTGRPVRVVWGLDSMNVGGTELNAVRVAERLDPERVSLTVACLGGEGPMSERYAEVGVEVIHFPIESLYGPSAWRQGLRLARFLRRRSAHVFHAHDIYSNIFGLPWARLAGTPRVIGSRRWWEGPASRAHTVANRIAYRFAHRVLVNAPALKELVAEKEGIPPERMTYVPNFVEEEAFQDVTAEERERWRARLGIPDNTWVVGITANLRPEKDHPTLFEAVRILLDDGVDVHLAVVGDGPERGALEEMTRSMAIGERVTFTGHQPNRPNLHQLFDVSVLCSQTEGFSNALVEAMAAGKPVVATRVGGTPDVVEDGVSGFLVPVGEAAALARKVGQVLSDPKLAGDLGRRGRMAARRRYGERHVLGSWISLYAAPFGRPVERNTRRRER